MPWISWLYSLMLPVALWLILVTVLLQIRTEPDLITFAVTDGSTGTPISGAELIVATAIYRTDERGEVTLRPPAVDSTILVRAEGYRAMRGSFVEGADRLQRVSLTEATVIGRVVDELSGDPIEGARVFVTDADGDVGSRTRSDGAGNFRLVRLPERATLHVEADGFISATLEVGTQASVTVTLTAVSGSWLEKAHLLVGEHRTHQPDLPLWQPASLLFTVGRGDPLPSA